MTGQNLMMGVLAALLLASRAAGHMIMQSPVPYAVDKVDNGPLSGGADFPCKRNLGYSVSKVNQMAVGDTQTISFEGSAVHGGGSCQLSISLDKEPTPDSVFKVIHSIEGGCPGINKAETFDYQIPSSIPNGEATFAWTWISKLSGVPEFYMNCGRVAITGGAQDTTAFDKLPDMFVANIADTKCETNPDFKVGSTEYPDPGSSLQKIDDGDPRLGVPPDTCGKAVAPPPSGPGNSTSSAPPAPTTSKGGSPPPASSSTLSTVTTSSGPEPTSTSTPPSGGGSESCSGLAMLCKGTSQFGLCNNGKVVWQDVAPGTQCKDGKIMRKRSSPEARRARRAAWKERAE